MFTIPEIAAAGCGRIVGPETGGVRGVSSDSRTVGPGELFVPLRGERFDGHDFIAEVVAKGVTVVLAKEWWLEKNTPSPDITIIAVKDTLRALGDLAAAHRRRFAIPVIGVTGSNGKTTTKEMLAAILGQGGAGLKTEGNLNNLIGLPQMLFRLRPEHRWAVLEMGMSEPGEIDRLAEVAAPLVGVVLNAFPAHLESMGSVENVARAKGELLLRLPAGGCAVFNCDDPLVALLPSPPGVPRLSFGLADADVRATEIESLGIGGQRFNLHLPGGSSSVRLQAFGRHNVYNALAAAAAAHAVGVAPEQIKNGLEAFRPFDKRFRLEEAGGLVLIDDSYNANPASMAAALETLAELKGAKRAFVALGAMLELGGDEAGLHRTLGMQAARVADRLYLCGDLTVHTAEGALSAGMPAEAVIQGMTREEIVADILTHAAAGDFVLAKGSRGMRMELVAAGIRNRP
ncbi:MAG: UDP-N-acetylmuramoyl-tripeptide--D-alanyl-D-alanine ligase [Deltaproteobacteria bacterium]|nr:UDP-N-acetylmuramoyl-tripeptide--D-alanyl-D-alanine ligase [Deltaproteobacteria bacterium]